MLFYGFLVKQMTVQGFVGFSFVTLDSVSAYDCIPCRSTLSCHCHLNTLSHSGEN